MRSALPMLPWLALFCVLFVGTEGIFLPQYKFLPDYSPEGGNGPKSEPNYPDAWVAASAEETEAPDQFVVPKRHFYTHFWRRITPNYRGGRRVNEMAESPSGMDKRSSFQNRMNAIRQG